jgi:flagellar basal-body rod protein FlgF
MSGLIEAASAILSASERKLEATANNVSNLSTPGFKRQVTFSELMPNQSDWPSNATRADLTQGKLNSTGNPLDIAITGPGFLQLRSAKQVFYSRQGQFRVEADGAVVTPQGLVLQQQGGGDLTLDNAAVKVLEDGTVLDDGKPVAHIAVFASTDESGLQAVGGSLFKAPEMAMQESTSAGIRQGMLESSNVSLGDEMVTMMTAMREAEGGSRLVQTYDDLIERAVTTFGLGTK